jgi:hypothetical protein
VQVLSFESYGMMVGIYYFHIGEVWLFELTFSVDISYKVIFQKKKKSQNAILFQSSAFQSLMSSGDA